jgi:hypothetical protein
MKTAVIEMLFSNAGKLVRIDLRLQFFTYLPLVEQTYA